MHHCDDDKTRSPMGDGGQMGLYFYVGDEKLFTRGIACRWGGAVRLVTEMVPKGDRGHMMLYCLACDETWSPMGTLCPWCGIVIQVTQNGPQWGPRTDVVLWLPTQQEAVPNGDCAQMWWLCYDWQSPMLWIS